MGITKVDGDDYSNWLNGFIGTTTPAVQGWLRGDFDGADAQFGKLFRHAMQNHRVKTADHHELRHAKGLAAKHFIDGEIADAGMNADGQIQTACFFVQGKKVGIVQCVVRFDAAHEDGASAISF